MLAVVRRQCVLRLCFHDANADFLEDPVTHVRTAGVDLLSDLAGTLPYTVDARELREGSDAVAVLLLADLKFEVPATDFDGPMLLQCLRTLEMTLGWQVGFGRLL